MSACINKDNKHWFDILNRFVRERDWSLYSSKLCLKLCILLTQLDNKCSSIFKYLAQLLDILVLDDSTRQLCAAVWFLVFIATLTTTLARFCIFRTSHVVYALKRILSLTACNTWWLWIQHQYCNNELDQEANKNSVLHESIAINSSNIRWSRPIYWHFNDVTRSWEKHDSWLSVKLKSTQLNKFNKKQVL